MVCRIVAVVSVLAALAAPAFAVGKPTSVSWGKPNVPFASYNEDAQACSNRAFGVKVGMLPKTAEALGALQGMSFYSFFNSWNFYQHGGNLAAVEAVRPDRVPFRNTTYNEMYRHAAYVDVVEQLQAVVDSCLVERGYQKFRLTGAQRDILHRLKEGTSEREHYLHSLGSDPQVLAAQGI